MLARLTVEFVVQTPLEIGASARERPPAALIFAVGLGNGL
jgi:hypothetical protein